MDVIGEVPLEEQFTTAVAKLERLCGGELQFESRPEQIITHCKEPLDELASMGQRIVPLVRDRLKKFTEDDDQIAIGVWLKLLEQIGINVEIPEEIWGLVFEMRSHVLASLNKCLMDERIEEGGQEIKDPEESEIEDSDELRRLTPFAREEIRKRLRDPNRKKRFGVFE